MTTLPSMGTMPNSRYTARATSSPAHMVRREPGRSGGAGRGGARAGPAPPPGGAAGSGAPPAGRNPGSVSCTLTTPAAPSRPGVRRSRRRPVLGVGGRRLLGRLLALDDAQLQVRPVGLLVVVAVAGPERRVGDVLVDALAEPGAHGLGRVAAESAGPPGWGGGGGVS